MSLGIALPQRFAAGWTALASGLSADARRRIALVALALVAQSLADLPGQVVNAVAGPLAPLVNIGFPTASILLVAVAILTPATRAPRWLLRVVLIAAIAAAALGALQVARSVIASFTHASYSNDGTSLDQYAALLLLRGHDPYQDSSLIAAQRTLGQDAEYTTPLRLGHFANRAWQDYPTPTELHAVAAQAPDLTAAATPEFESRVSYPAFGFLPLVPFVAVGLPSVVFWSLLCMALFAWFALRAVEPGARPWLAMLILADVPLWNSVLTGSLDITVLLLTFLAWLWWDRPWLATIALGLDLATKQQAWFFALFFLIFVWRQAGWRVAGWRLAGALGIFLLLNLPFILHDAGAWTAGVLAPIRDPMFPRGRGLMQLALNGWLPLWPQAVYTTLEILALLAALGWYAWRGARRFPEMGLVLAMAPLWFAWRSLASYFFFIALPTVALWLAWRWPAPRAAPIAPAPALAPTKELA